MHDISNSLALESLKKFPECKAFLLLDDPTPEGQDENRAYVYEWIEEDTGVPFYVGRGIRNRYNHILWKAKKPKRSIYQTILQEHGMECKFIAVGLTYHESKIIAYAEIKRLTSEGIELQQSLREWNLSI